MEQSVYHNQHFMFGDFNITKGTIFCHLFPPDISTAPKVIELRIEEL